MKKPHIKPTVKPQPAPAPSVNPMDALNQLAASGGGAATPPQGGGMPQMPTPQAKPAKGKPTKKGKDFGFTK